MSETDPTMIAAKQAWQQQLADRVSSGAGDMVDAIGAEAGARKSWLAQIESASMQANVEARAGVGTKQHRIEQLEQALATMSAQLTDANRTIAMLQLPSWARDGATHSAPPIAIGSGVLKDLGGGDVQRGADYIIECIARGYDRAAAAEAEAQRADEPPLPSDDVYEYKRLPGGWISFTAKSRALMSDPPQSDPEAPPSRGVVDQVVDALDKRLVGRSDRVRLRGALDKADAPLTGRAGADEALGRIARLARLR